MKKKISKYISLLLLLNSVLMLPIEAAAKDNKSKKEEKEKVEVVTYQGISAGLDIAGLGSYLFGGDIMSTEINVNANLKNEFFPVVEIGFGKTNTTNENNGMHYKTAAPYFRIGLDYNIMHKKPHLPGALYAGLRYGFTVFNYDVSGPDMTDPNYGGATTLPYAYSGLQGNAHWAEVLLGIKVRIYRRFHMGWTIRFKKSISVKESEFARPWYIPGYGKMNPNSFGLTFNLIYNLPF